MELISLIGEFFASAFAWVVESVGSIWQALTTSAFMTGLTNVLGSGIAKFLVASTLLLLAATALKAMGVIDSDTLKIFVAIFILAIAISIFSCIMSGNYWFAFGLLVFAVLVLAAAATIDPEVAALAIEILQDAVELTGDIIGGIVDGVASAATNLASPILIGLGLFLGYKALTSKKGTKDAAAASLH